MGDGDGDAGQDPARLIGHRALERGQLLLSVGRGWQEPQGDRDGRERQDVVSESTHYRHRTPPAGNAHSRVVQVAEVFPIDCDRDRSR